VRLEVLADNVPAIALYEATGFRRSGTRPHRKDGAQRALVGMELARRDYRPR
jgi:ribosomal protein S18 acetylase RimI-like enzyme